MTALQRRHNDHDGVSIHQSHDCILNRLFRCRSKKTSRLRVTGLCAGISPVPRTMGQLLGKCFHLMTSSWIGEGVSLCIIRTILATSVYIDTAVAVYFYWRELTWVGRLSHWVPYLLTGLINFHNCITVAWYIVRSVRSSIKLPTGSLFCFHWFRV